MCPISVSGPQTDTTTRAAAEGTFLHGVCEAVLLKGDKHYPAYGSVHSVYGFEFEFTEAMHEDCEVYVKHVRSRPWIGNFEVEGRVHYSRSLSVPYATAYGTADCFGFTDGDGLGVPRALEIIDLKMGRKAVSPTDNPQAALYAAGVMEFSDDIILLPDSHAVRITIVQPRLSQHPFTWETTVGTVRRMMRELRPAAQAAVAFHRGEATAEQVQQFPEMPGAHCGYCKRKAQCSAVNKAALTAVGNPFTAKTFNTQVFKLRDVIRNYLDELEEHALMLSLAGNAPEGVKLVRGRRGKPAFCVTEDALYAFAAKYGVDKDTLAPVERALKTPAKVRDLLKKVGVPEAEVAKVVTSPEGGLQIADISDPRPAEKAAGALDEEMFSGVDTAQKFVL